MESDGEDVDVEFALHEDWDISDPVGDKLSGCVDFFCVYNEVMSKTQLGTSSASLGR